jgi:hypothetical protein
MRCAKGNLVTDLLILTLSAALFGAAIYFVRACDRM